MGEVRGGVNGNEAFFDALEAGWVCVHVEPLQPFPECFEQMWVLRRKKALRRWWRLWLW